MGKVRVEIISNEFLKSEEVGNYIESVARQIASRCGSGYESDLKLMPTRWIASVYTDSKEAAKDNNKNNTILKNLR